jgi:DNA polymerase III delta prime subunit
MISVLEKLFPTDLYHSYVIEGDPNTTKDELLGFLELRGEINKNSPDVICQMYESFTMDDTSLIKEWHSKLGVSNSKKVCIIATKFINREAEQTLLKIIEEPSLNTHFFIIIPDSSILLPTIISRVHVIKMKEIKDDEMKQLVLSFLNISPTERIKKVAEIIEKNKDKENSGQLRYYATQFVNEIESIFYIKFKKDISDEKNKFVLSELQKARGYLSTPGASVKMILEHLALIMYP